MCFEELDRNHTRSRDRREPSTERVGKKYQRIALQELLAHLADNCAWVTMGYDDVDNEYSGPWQIYRRDIDPTLFYRYPPQFSANVGSNHSASFFNLMAVSAEDPERWLWDESSIQNIASLLLMNAKDKGSTCLNLRADFHINEAVRGTWDFALRLDVWIRVSSVFIHKRDLHDLLNNIKGIPLTDPRIVNIPEIRQGFTREYPWHPSVLNISCCQEKGSITDAFNVCYLPTVVEYFNDTTDGDYSLTESISLNLPAFELINHLGLTTSNKQLSAWARDSVTIFTIRESSQVVIHWLWFVKMP